ncbi:hypothetical protein BGX33_001185 [Mortierella sp. NVP41]|nr:hypothetical protein BGX33_001185 [Mortierella sp. NVP41]
MVHIDSTHFALDASNELAEALAKPASFKLKYFPMLSNGATSRDLLAYGGVEWESLFPGDWNAEKSQTPFHLMPLLLVTGENGKTATLAESVVIEHYLAKKFGLLGSNEYEESVIKMLHSSTAAVQNAFAGSVTWNAPDAKVKGLAFFNASTLPSWIETREKHLKANGNNGYYVGNKLSLADIRTANAIEHFATQPESEALMAIVNKSAALLKVCDTVNKHPKMVEWKSGKQYKAMYEGNIGFFADPFAYMQ